MCYLNSTIHYGLLGKIGDPPEDLELSLFVDADFAGDKEDTKSTSGNFPVLTGPNTYFPLSWASAKQTATSRSTTESEVVSLALGVFSESIPASILWSLILGRDIKTKIFEDNQATITVVKKGYSKKLRHISRTHKVNLGSLKEVCTADDTELAYIDTKKQAADIFTKAFANADKWNDVKHMICVVDPTTEYWIPKPPKPPLDKEAAKAKQKR